MPGCEKCVQNAGLWFGIIGTFLAGGGLLCSHLITAIGTTGKVFIDLGSVLILVGGVIKAKSSIAKCGNKEKDVESSVPLQSQKNKTVASTERSTQTEVEQKNGRFSVINVDETGEKSSKPCNVIIINNITKDPECLGCHGRGLHTCNNNYNTVIKT